jgi:hypothetical protein
MTTTPYDVARTNLANWLVANAPAANFPEGSHLIAKYIAECVRLDRAKRDQILIEAHDRAQFANMMGAFNQAGVRS